MFPNFIKYILNTALSSLHSSLAQDKINHVTPLRAHPQRFYFLDRANVDNVHGDNLVEVLKENPDLTRKVNGWLSTFGIQIGVSEIRHIIHQLKVNQDNLNLNLDITDVGFGISQILPVIVQGFLASEGSLTLVEQPEIHLHPRMQGALADLFIDIVQTGTHDPYSRKNRHLLIETHSEYLLKRIRLRMAEGKTIDPNQVAIYYVEKTDGGKGAEIREIEISPSGQFEWPKDFYIDDLEDTIGYLKAITTKDGGQL